jgi:hypothetical protein
MGFNSAFKGLMSPFSISSVLNSSVHLFAQSNPVNAQRGLKVGASVMYQHGYMQQMQIILMIPAYGVTDILSRVGDWF